MKKITIILGMLLVLPVYAGPNYKPPYNISPANELVTVETAGRAWLKEAWIALTLAIQRDIGKEPASKSGLIGWGTPDAIPPKNFNGMKYEFVLDKFGDGTATIRILYLRPLEEYKEWIAIPAKGGDYPFRVETPEGIVECANGYSAFAVARNWRSQ